MYAKKLSFLHLETLEFDSAVLVLLKLGGGVHAEYYRYPKPKEFGFCAKLTCGMRIDHFD